MADQSHEDFLAPSPPVPAELPEPDSGATPEPLVQITARAGTEVALEGQVFQGRSTLSAPRSLADEWLAFGWAASAPRAVKAAKQPLVSDRPGPSSRSSGDLHGRAGVL